MVPKFQMPWISGSPQGVRGTDGAAAGFPGGVAGVCPWTTTVANPMTAVTNASACARDVTVFLISASGGVPLDDTAFDVVLPEGPSDSPHALSPAASSARSVSAFAESSGETSP